jgi:hypothetical protein
MTEFEDKLKRLEALINNPITNKGDTQNRIFLEILLELHEIATNIAVSR